MAIIERFGVDVLTITESTGLSPTYRSGSDLIVFTETYGSTWKQPTGKDYIDIVEDYGLQRLFVRDESDTITITERYSRGTHAREGFDTISISEVYTQELFMFFGVDTITITETYDFEIAKGNSDTITITESYDRVHIQNLFGADTLVIEEGYSQYKPTPYKPAYPINVTTSNDPLMFKQGSVELTCRHYEFGNFESLEYARVSRTTRGGDLLIGPNTAETRTLDFTLNLSSETQCNQLMAFFRTNLGKQIEFRDHEGTWWDGVILNPDTQRKQNGRCSFSMQVQFEGVPQ